MLIMIEAEGSQVLVFVADDGQEAAITPVFAAGKPVFLIGSHENAHLRLTGESIAPAHAALSMKAGVLVVQPRFPSLEVLVNERVVTRPTALMAGDVVRIGDHRFTLAETVRPMPMIAALDIDASPQAQPVTAPTVVQAVAVSAPRADVVIEDPQPEQQVRVYAPSVESSSGSRSRAPVFVAAVLAMIGLAFAGGYGIVSRLTAAPVVDTPAFAYYDGNATLVMFDATWCQYCAQQKPIVRQLADEYRGNLYVNYVDIDMPENRGLVNRYGASSIPLIVIFNDQGEVVATLRGVNEAPTLRRSIDNALATSTGVQPTT